MSTALIVLAKAPLPGLAKTRLIPALGTAGAAHLAQRLLWHTLQHASAVPVDHHELCVTPDTHHPAFDPVREITTPHWHITWQGDGDLGERMQRAFARHLPHHAHVLLIGTDAPGLTPAHLQQAEAALQTHDAVFVPALDGGYALIGLNQPCSALFMQMPWSTSQVMAETRRRLARAGLTHHELTAVADIDEPDDLVHLPAGWP